MSDVEVFTIGALLALMPGLVALALLILRVPIDEEDAPGLIGLKLRKTDEIAGNGPGYTGPLEWDGERVSN
jgi:hypothetical protein